MTRVPRAEFAVTPHAATSPWATRDTLTAAAALTAILLHLVLRYGLHTRHFVADAPLLLLIATGGLPLVLALARKALAGEFGSDLLAGMAIVTATLVGQYLTAAVIVLMLSGGQALEQYATRRASSVLDALARRSPDLAHRRNGAVLVDVPLEDVSIGDALVVLPYEVCPVDGVVRDGSSSMDESFLSGEPFLLRKTAGSGVISGAINGEGTLTIEAQARAQDSRYERIMQILRSAELRRPRMRRMANRLGAWYTPLAVAVAAGGWFVSGDPSRFLAVLVIATPCPLLLAIPVALIGGVSLSARRSILIRDVGIFERLEGCRTVIFDKTGTLTLGRPELTEVVPLGGYERRDVLALSASLEQYSKHPLASAILRAADTAQAGRVPVTRVSERPGQGLTGHAGDRIVRLTSRREVPPDQQRQLPAEGGGLECVVLVDGAIAALLRFRDVPRRESQSLVRHFRPRHGIERVLLVSGDRESEVRYLAGAVGIHEVHFNQAPEQKVAIVEAETVRARTIFVGDGLNDAPAMASATVGVALGQSQAVTAESAAAVILDGSLSRVDELIHIARRTRRVALQSAVGGMLLSGAGMGIAAVGWLSPLAGALAQEAIDIAAVLNALRAAMPPRDLTDFE